MDTFPNLPSVLKWEISLAVLVLLWSLASLRTRRAHRSQPRPARVGTRGRALLVAMGFAIAAASFAYAMPNLPALEGHKRPPELRLRSAVASERRGGSEADVTDQSPRGGGGSETQPQPLPRSVGARQRGSTPSLEGALGAALTAPNAHTEGALLNSAASQSSPSPTPSPSSELSPTPSPTESAEEP